MFSRKLNGKVTQAELDGDVFIGVELTPAQKKEAAAYLAAARKKSQQEMTEEVRVNLNQISIRGRIDDCLQKEKYDPEMSFAYWLKKYVDVLDIKRKDFAQQIGIDETLLSQLINGHRLPPDYIAIRLEIHSDKLIPADRWYKLVSLEKQHYIKTDQEIRKKQRKYVHVPVYDTTPGSGNKKAYVEDRPAKAGGKRQIAAAGVKSSRVASL
jgi:plasmid maintenance system antidote protein VapI